MNATSSSVVIAAVLAITLYPLWTWSVADRWRMNRQQKYIAHVVRPAVIRGQRFPDGRALKAMTMSLRHYLSRHPDDARPAMVLALCLRAAGRDNDAFLVYQRTQNVEPRGELDLQIGMLHLQRGDTAAAEKAFYAAVRKDRRLLEVIPHDSIRRDLKRRIRTERPWLYQ